MFSFPFLRLLLLASSDDVEANLNQLARALNQKGSASNAQTSKALTETREQLKHVHRELLGQ